MNHLLLSTIQSDVFSLFISVVGVILLLFVATLVVCSGREKP